MSQFPPDYVWPEHALPASLDDDRGQRCSYCGLGIRWGVTKNGKRCPYDLAEPHPSHWITCPQRRKAAAALKRPKKAPAVAVKFGAARDGGASAAEQQAFQEKLETLAKEQA